MLTNYPNYQWEAHEVTSSDGYISTLFHLTGVETDAAYQAERQPVLVVNGSLSNSLSWVFEDPLAYTNKDIIGYFQLWFFYGDVMAPRTDDQWYELAGYIKAVYPDVWDNLVTVAAEDEEEPTDLEALYTEAGLTAQALSQDDIDCVRLGMDEWWAGLEKAGFGTDMEDGDEQFRIESSLPIYLFDHGYDVWMNGNRGTYFNRKHVNDGVDASYSDYSEYWDFDFVEMGTKDVPALIEYVVGATGVDQISYVGYSQGTTLMYQALAMGVEDAEL